MIQDAACVGKHKLFDSTHPLDHLEARAICATCPALLACTRRRDEVRSGSGYAQTSLTGTWAGQLFGDDTKRARRAFERLLEEREFTEEQARAAHAAWVRGEKTPKNAAGERVYQRRKGREKQKQKSA